MKDKLSFGNPRYPFFIFMTLVSLYFIENFLRAAPSALTPILIKELGLTHGLAGLLVASSTFIYSIMQVPGGIISDVVGPRRTIIGFTIFSVIGVYVFYIGSRLETLMVAQTLLGLGFSILYINSVKLLSDWFPASSRASVIGGLSAALNLGSFAAYIGFPLASSIAVGWRTLYLYSIILLTVFFVANLIILKDSQNIEAKIKISMLTYFRKIIDVLKNRRMYALLIGYFLTSFSWVFFSWRLQFLTDTRGFSYLDAGLISSVGTVAGIPGSILIGIISDRLRRRKLPLTCFSSFYVLMLVLFLSLPNWTPIPIFNIVSFAMGFSSSWWGLLFSMISESIPHENVGLALGILNTLGPLGFAILAPIYGSLVDISGSYFFSNTLILIGGVIMTVIYIFFTQETYGGIGHTRVTVQSHKT